MHVAFLAPDVDLGGTTGDVWHVKDLTIAIAKLGCKVDLVVGGTDGWIPPPGVRVHATRNRSAVLTALALSLTFRRDVPDVFYERRGSPKLAYMLGKLTHRPYFVEINGLPELEKQMQGRSDEWHPWVRALRYAARGQLLWASDGIVTVTEGLMATLVRLHRLPHRKFTVLPNGVDLDAFCPLSMKEMRRHLGFSPDIPIAIFVGNLVRWQGVHTLIQAMPILLRELPRTQVLIVGGGIERANLEALARDLSLSRNICFAGPVPRPDVPKWISAADIAVMPATLQRNLQIGSSALKLREYLACGRPVVATNLEGGGQLLEREGIGIGVEGDSAKDLARAMLGVLKDPQLRDRMGQRARQYAVRELSWDLVAARLLAIFKDGIARTTGKQRRETRPQSKSSDGSTHHGSL